MKVIILPRRGGKTTKLISKADNYNGYIVCHNKLEAERIMSEAKKLNKKINWPLTYNDLLSGHYYKPGIKKFHIDNVGVFLQRITQVPIDTVTLDEELITRKKK